LHGDFFYEIKYLVNPQLNILHILTNPVGKIPIEFFPFDICNINLHCSFFKPKPNLFFIFVSKNEFNIQAADIMSKEELDINTITGFYTLV
jgi:hypothetical protein